MQIQLEHKDYLNATYLHYIHTSSPRPFIVTSVLLLLDGLGILGLAVLQKSLALSIISAIFILMGILSMLNIFVLWPRRTRTVFSQQKSMQEPFELEILETGLKRTSENSESLYPWEDFHEWREDDKQFVLYLSELSFLIIPKRFDQERDAVTQIKTHLRENRVRRNKRNRRIGRDRFLIRNMFLGLFLVLICAGLIILWTTNSDYTQILF